MWRFELFTVPADFEGLDGCPADARYLCDRRAGGAPGLLDLLATGRLFRGTVVYFQVPAHEGILLGRLYGLPGDRLEPAADGRLRLVFADGGGGSGPQPASLPALSPHEPVPRPASRPACRPSS